AQRRPVFLSKSECRITRAVNATRALRDNRHPRAERLQQSNMLSKRCVLIRKIARGEMRAVPAADEPQVMARERLGERGWRARIGVSQLGAGKTRLAHLA